MAKASKKVHPMIAAVLNELPVKPVNGFGIAERASWLRLMASTFDVVYGPAAPLAIGLDRPVDPPLLSQVDLDQIATRPQVAKPNPPRFFIDKQGYARKDPGGIRIMPGNIDAGDVLFDDRGEHGDLATITWSDGSQGVLGLQLDISATPDQAKVV